MATSTTARTPASPDPSIMHPASGGPSSNGNDNSQLAYLKKLAADLQSKIHALENTGMEKLDAAKHKVESVVDSVTSGSTNSVQKHMGLLLMGPPGAGAHSLLYRRLHLQLADAVIPSCLPFSCPSSSIWLSSDLRKMTNPSIATSLAALEPMA